jgi:hypothetical protein
MRTLAKLGMLAALSGTLFLTSCAGDYYVSDQPADVVYQRPAPPYGGAVWIEGDWSYNGGRYVHQQGHWARARAGHNYVAGNWEHTARGYRWHKGRWQ